MTTRFKSPHLEDRDNFASLLGRTSDAMVKHLTERPSMPVECSTPPAALRRELSSLPLPVQGMAPGDILTFLAEKVMPFSVATNHARSYGWVNSSPAPIAILGDALATTLNNGLDGGDHPSVLIGHSLGRWLMELSGFVDAEGTPNGMAILLAGGSAANLNALSVARHWAAKRDGWNIREEGLQGQRPPMIYYTSAEAHSSVQRCVEQLGIGTANLRQIETDDRFRMRPEALRESIENDRAAGLRPTCVVVACGSTNVGAVDPLAEIADVCEEQALWLHVDGAYGGILGLDPEYTEQTRALDRADSLTLDPHKWLQVPYDCGALLVRDRRRNHECYHLAPDYLDAANDEDIVPWPYEHMFELTFGDRALKTWAAVARLGRDGVRDLVVNCTDLARLLGKLVEDADDLELLAPVSASVVNFRYVPTGAPRSAEVLDALNQRISDEIEAGGEAHIPTTKVDGAVSLRACILHYENCEEDVHQLVALVRRVAEGGA